MFIQDESSDSKYWYLASKQGSIYFKKQIGGISECDGSIYSCHHSQKDKFTLVIADETFACDDDDSIISKQAVRNFRKAWQYYLM